MNFLINMCFKFVTQFFNPAWNEAKSNCIALGGKLFSDLDGTEFQLRSLQSLMSPGNSYWVGIYSDDHVVWKTSEEKVVTDDLLNWKPNEPNNVEGEEFHVELGSSEWFNELNENRPLSSICDMSKLLDSTY